ncbi:MAG: YggW family oxidoreductase [Ferrovum sp. 37-45-19]|jgi:oxygen-independent coproporphyrinogen-3 oxidase|uniref:radical SAM family heme chaperone HemW n=1 Tax=Ferrovum sp. JA12 TaxID=1356299 RepID=UPI00070384F1|nr:radical SAM family heme chaperone HemW [Ferrovum sp. JA12]OYV79596.1 MAG: YggW family oxidoreductase [Ferrovum sp. 21-44-67]OYV94609.1 MAG: YggW family oxidoreductase [Ferrovum sp. 37-45-19]OZB34564.1 MAG: YggW family oxidoreductase [Ferrovum sp. 34-44-207]HQT81520.1 radical SAM family heme chaperone HemW [Ferrovaceae bacterium]KRH79492.1 oxygen-independent coproporphyrinogen-III oxidase-like protein YqeR [Ferrovum sp. JA12]
MSLQILPPLSLYIHFPWCIKKCPYCDFNSHELKSPLDERKFIDALLLDFQQQLPRIWGRPLRSIFIGGGTPSLLSAQSISYLMSSIRSLAVVLPNCEVTLEANPGTFESVKFSGFREAGINRLSLGVQSLNDRCLKAIGRVHDREQAVLAISEARMIFDNLNCDLMYGLPGQTHEEAMRDLQEVISFNPTHISFYQLTIEPNTLFYKFPPQLPDQDDIALLEKQIYDLLAERSYLHYEVSAYAKEQYQSKHNLNYWMFGDYVGIGPGAHGKISFPDRIIRTAKIKHPNNYLASIDSIGKVEEMTIITDSHLPFEFMMNALRLNQGFPLSLFEERTGLSINTIQSVLELAEESHLITLRDRYLRPTQRGRLFLNDLISLFLNE